MLEVLQHFADKPGGGTGQLAAQIAILANRLFEKEKQVVLLVD